MISFDAATLSRINEGFQSLGGSVPASGEPSQAQSPDDKLLNEFSEVLDKIASYLSSNRRAKGQGSPFAGISADSAWLATSELAARHMEHTAVKVAQVESKEKESASESSSEAGKLESKSESPEPVKSQSAAESQASNKASEDRSDSAPVSVSEEKSESQPAREQASDCKPNLQKTGTPEKADTKADQSKIESSKAEDSGDISTEPEVAKSTTDLPAELPEDLAKFVAATQKAQGNEIAPAQEKSVQAIEITTLAQTLISHMLGGEGFAAGANSHEVMESLLGSKAIEGLKSVQGSSSTQNQIQNGTGPGSFQRVSENTAQIEARALKVAPRVIPPRTMERIESTLKEVAQSKDGTKISLRLDPPSLGSLKIEMSLKDGTLHARLVAQSPEVGTYLRDKSHDLQAMLRGLGLDVKEVRVSVSSDSSQMLGDQQGQGDGSAQGALDKNGDSILGVNGESDDEGTKSASVLDHWVA